TYFFFQAEDGIRDFHVTGVQTCALPIFSIMANLPIDRERLALRAVVHSASEGGYIDNAGRGETDVNRVGVNGGRATLLWAPDDEIGRASCRESVENVLADVCLAGTTGWT